MGDRSNMPLDFGIQEAALRKKISELEKEKDALERESTTNRNMYDKMKTVNRNMKEVIENRCLRCSVGCRL